MSGRVVRWLSGGLALTAAAVAVLRGPEGRRRARRLAHTVARRARYQSGRIEGLRYHWGGGGPDPNEVDGVLADRVRSMLGPLEHRLDIPRVHVMAEGHEVLLHGSVDTEAQEQAVVSAVKGIPGVRSVQSHLHVGLGRGDTRPSAGELHPAPSAALRSVMDAAHRAGAPAGTERAMAASVLSTFGAQLPDGERRHVLSHLPSDVRDLAVVPQARWLRARHTRRTEEFTRQALPAVAAERRLGIVTSVLGAVGELVPEEVDGVAAVLPGELKELWRTAVAR